MPWNDNSKPGPWGAPPPRGGSGGGDRGENRRPGGGPRRPSGPGRGAGGPDLEEIGRRTSERLRAFFQEPDGRWRPRAIGAVAGALVGLWLLSGLYVVGADQQSVVTTFGAYSRSEGPGLRYHLPFVERYYKLPVTSLRSLDVGGGTDPDLDESLMLTGDENIVDLRFTVQWRVADAAKYQFQVRDQEDVLKDVAESAMREVIGQTQLQTVLTTGRSQVEQRVETLMRRILEAYGAGIEISEVQIRSASPPTQVVDAFREVQSAGQQAEAAVNQANGEAARQVQSALAYRSQVVREAEGDAARFNQLYEQYRLSPAATRERLYLETMERVLANSNKVIVDSKGATAPVVLPPEALRPKTNTPAAASQGGR